MTRIPKYVCLCGLLLTAALPASAVQRADLLPENRLFDFQISNIGDFLSGMKQSSFGRLWADPQFQNFLGNPEADDWMDLISDGGNPAEREMLAEQFKAITGEVLAALTSDADDLYLVLAMSPEDFERSLVLDEKLAALEDADFRIVNDVFQDIDLIRHIADPGTPMESSTWQAHLNNTLVMGPSREWVERSIVQLKKEPVEEPEGHPALTLNMPLSYIIGNIVREAEMSGVENAEAGTAQLFESLGLLGIESFSSRIELTEEEMVMDNQLLVDSLDKGLFTMLDMTPVEMPSVGFIPETITQLEVGRVNLPHIWKEIPVMLDAVLPELKPQFDSILSSVRQQIGIDLEQDLIAHLGTRYLGFTTLENEVLLSVLAIELSDSQSFRQTLARIMSSPAVQPDIDLVLDTVDFLDHTLYVSKNPDPAEAFAFAVSGNYLLYGEPDSVRQVIRAESSPNAANNRFEQTELVQQLRRFVPTGAFGFSAIDWRKNMAFLVRQVQQPENHRLLLEEWAMSGAPIPPPEFDKLPPADYLASFFNMSYQYVERTSRGLHHHLVLRY